MVSWYFLFRGFLVVAGFGAEQAFGLQGGGVEFRLDPQQVIDEAGFERAQVGLRGIGFGDLQLEGVQRLAELLAAVVEGEAQACERRLAVLPGFPDHPEEAREGRQVDDRDPPDEIRGEDRHGFYSG